MTAFAMFLILIAIFAYIIYGYAGTVSAMMFAALAANLSPMPTSTSSAPNTT